MFFNSGSSGNRSVDLLTIGAGYAPVAFRHTTLGDPALNFVTVTNGADTEVTQWLDQSGNGHHATAAIATAGGSDNMLLVPAFNGRTALAARSMTTPFGTPQAPVRKGRLLRAAGFPGRASDGGWTQHFFVSLGQIGDAVNCNTIIGSAVTPATRWFRQLTSGGPAWQGNVSTSGVNALNLVYNYPIKNNWLLFSQTFNVATLEQKLYINGNFVSSATLASVPTDDTSFCYGAIGAFPGSFADALYGMVQVHAGVLTEADIIRFCQAEFARWGLTGSSLPIYIDFLGNSIAAGLYAIPNIGDTATGRLTILHRVCEKLLALVDGNGNRKIYSANGWNYGVNGLTTAQVLANAQSAPTASGTGTMIGGGAFVKTKNPGCRMVCSIMELTNTFFTNSRNAAAAYADLITLVTAAKATGKYDDIAVWTALPRFQSTLSVSSPTTCLVTPGLFALNDLVRTGMQQGGSLRAAGATRLIDVQKIAGYNNADSPVITGTPGDGVFGRSGTSPFTRELYAPNGETTSPGNSFATDGVHPSGAGAQLLADLFVQEMGF
jgi:hypothetical protein